MTDRSLLKVCATRCDECPFSPNKLVSAARRREILDDCKATDRYFTCHKGTIAGVEIVCRGFYDALSSTSIQLAQRFEAMGLVEPGKGIAFVDPDSLGNPYALDDDPPL